MQQKEVILEGTIKAFNEKGLKFTMDDVAKILGICLLYTSPSPRDCS